MYKLSNNTGSALHTKSTLLGMFRSMICHNRSAQSPLWERPAYGRTNINPLTNSIDVDNVVVSDGVVRTLTPTHLAVAVLSLIVGPLTIMRECQRSALLTDSTWAER